MNIIERLKFAFGSNLYIQKNVIIDINPNQKKTNIIASLLLVPFVLSLFSYLISKDKNDFYLESFIFMVFSFNGLYFLYFNFLIPKLIIKYFFIDFFKYILLQAIGIFITVSIFLIIFYLKIIAFPPILYNLSYTIILVFSMLISSLISNWTVTIYLNDILISASSNNNINLLKKKENELIINQQLINPHFLANSLSNLQSLIRLGKYEQALKFNSELVTLYTQQMMYSSKEVTLIEDEINWLKSYLEVEKERFSDKFQYSIVVKNEELLFYVLPPLLLQPIVENSIKHGYVPNLENMFSLNIIFEEIKNNVLRIEINDNGNGNADTNLLKKVGHSFALKNIKNRIDLINSIGKFKINYTHKLMANGSNTEITINANDPFLTKS